MKSTNESKRVLLDFTNEEAIVLHDWVSRFNQGENEEFFADQAEVRVLWDIEACLEKAISDTFNSNYNELLALARSKVRD